MGALEARLGRSDSLADAHAIGDLGGSGMTEQNQGLEAAGGDAGLANHPTPVPGVMYQGEEQPLTLAPSDLDPARREGLGRAQQHRITMGTSHEQYVDSPDLDGRHAVIVGRPILPTADQQLPWESAPDVLFREVPTRDSDNPPPGDCS